MFFRTRKGPQPIPADTAPVYDDDAAYMDMIDRTQATIRFKTDGTIVDANENFLRALGYTLDEIRGKNHAIFVDNAFTATDAYRKFWTDLASGKSFTDQFARIRSDGSIIWIQATYAPVLDADGKAQGVVKIATDISSRQQAIEALSEGLRRLADGDLTCRLPIPDVPDLATLFEAFNVALTQLDASMTAVNGVANTVRQTAGEIGQASADLSRRTESQAATLEQTAAAVEELTNTANAAAESAGEVSKATRESHSTAERGGQVVGDAASAMGRIEESAKKISQIVSVIDEIAFQTNLLALNAGVEAARAGEAGRGFAVVASEVRALAQRAAESADQIKRLISESSANVADGVDLVARAGEELASIIAKVAGITDHVSDIANGASEQAATLNEINAAILQLDNATQQNAAMVEQSTAATNVLANDATELAGQMAAFKLSQGRPDPARQGGGMDWVRAAS